MLLRSIARQLAPPRGSSSVSLGGRATVLSNSRCWGADGVGTRREWAGSVRGALRANSSLPCGIKPNEDPLGPPSAMRLLSPTILQPRHPVEHRPALHSCDVISSIRHEVPVPLE